MTTVTVQRRLSAAEMDAYVAQEAEAFDAFILKQQAELHDAHVETFHDAMAEQYSDMAEVHQQYLCGVYTQAEYLEIEAQCHPALFN